MRRNAKIGVTIGISMILIGTTTLFLGFPYFFIGILLIAISPSIVMLSFQKEMRKWAMKRSAKMMKEMMADPEMKEMMTNNPMMQAVSQIRDSVSKPEPKEGNTICTKCGKEIAQDSKFCKECGTTI